LKDMQGGNGSNFLQLTNRRGRPHHDPMNDLGRRIRELRESLGLDQIEAGNLCGVGGSTFSLIETGKRPNPRIDTLTKIARGLGVSLDELVEPIAV